MAPRQTVLPFAYRVFFLIIEPLSTLLGAFYAHFRQHEYLAMTTRVPPSPTGMSDGTSIALSQLANLYLLFALNEALVLRSTGDIRVWKTVLFVLLVGDLGHLYSVGSLGSRVYWDVPSWNAMDWGNVGFVYLGASMRMAFLAGKMSQYDQYEGFQVQSPDTWTEFHKNKFDTKPFGDHDVEVKIECCGVCSSDIHTISGGWGAQKFPLAVGHEIVGKAVKVGPKVTLIKEGQRVGVGAQSWSCLECRQCKNDNETYCPKQMDTYGAVWPDTGIVTQGGYSSHVRTHEHWVFPIPDGLESHLAAPMLCAGITSYSPLVRNGAGPGKKVAVVGLGGLGHFAVLFAKALGAETWVISRSHSKEADARKMGADGYLASQDKDWNKDHRMTFDLIVSTANSFGEGFDLGAYLALLDVHGKWVSVGLPEEATLNIQPQDLLANGCLIGASHLGSRREMLEMLQLAADKGIKSWVETVPISAENLGKTMQRLHKNDVRYRFTMTDYDKAFGP
ncbi:NADP-dependent alcohol dehydrogenase-like protein [Hypoxylon sp. FL1150]|nr:NADP-dependent alcohol dehydrogenase-like protein [Hypoxylon sp. FL1150]